MLSIGQISKLFNVTPYTLRYWEKEFNGILTPKRTKGGQRRYSKQDRRVIQEIIELLREDMYSMKGAKRILLRKYKKKRY